MTVPLNHSGSRRLLVGSVASLALIVPLTACGSSSTSSSSASTAQSTTTTTPTASATDSSSMQMSPSDTPSMGDTSSDSASATDTASASTTPSVSTSPAGTSAGKSAAFSAKKDASVAAKLVQVTSLTMKKVVFPKTLSGLPMLGTVSEGSANRYVGYSDPNSSTTVTTTTSTNTDAGDVDDQASGFKNPSSYDGGRIKCGPDTVSSSQACIVHIAGPEQITVSTTSKLSNDQLAKYTAAFMNAQK